MANSKKTAAGCGNIRKKIIRRGGKEYEYWEARYTVGFDPGTGKQIQKSVSGKTQKEVTQKLKAATAALDEGTYIAPNKMTVAQWLDTWQADYLKGVKACHSPFLPGNNQEPYQAEHRSNPVGCSDHTRYTGVL